MDTDNQVQITTKSLKRHHSDNKSSPTFPKQHCSSARKPTISLQSIIHLPETEVWSLTKRDLRSYFIALQEYSRSSQQAVDPISLPSPPSQNESVKEIAPVLRLPLEIREQIYKYLIYPPASQPILGPHPRQLQNSIRLSQPVPANVLRLNRQIHNEALPLFYGSPEQVVSIKIDFNVWEHKTYRSDLVLSPTLTSCIKHVDLSIHLGSEKRNNKPLGPEAYARFMEVKKGVKKTGKWLAGADIRTLQIGWQEPPQTYTWDQKRDILDGLKTLRAVKVWAGEINWGLEWNRGKRYKFEVDYLKELERGWQDNSKDIT
ncbi:hypothetical protein BGZ60DRAFT_412939 [Tricladium varicosporioides]|nr:hypothetical protein BGZ60DRAFT_412939 [Hymenoscyphus varicosporioides]